MCSLAPPRRDARGLGAATSFLDRQRGVVAVAQKRGRHDGCDDPASSAAAALRVRMEKELVALQGLLKRAKLLPRSATPAAAPAEKKCDPSPRPSAKRRTTSSQSQPKAATEAAACQTQIKITAAPAANPKHQQPQHPVQVQEKERRTEEEENSSKDDLAARAAAREAFRQMLVEMEKAALPDETVYPEEMEEFGIPFEFVITRTWKQACLDYQANKNKCKRAGQQAATGEKTLAAAPGGPASRTIAV